MAYWYAESEDAERWHPIKDATSLEDAVAQARWSDGGEISDGANFYIAEANRQPWRFDCFSDIADVFNDRNEELGDIDGNPTPSEHSGINKGLADLEKRLTATLADWVTEYGEPMAWGLNFTAHHSIPATAEFQGE